MASKRLLLVVDMQNDFITGSLGTPEAREIVPMVCEKIKKWDGDVWFTRDEHYPDYLGTVEGKHLPVEHCLLDTPGWEICPEVQSACASRLYRGGSYVAGRIMFAYTKNGIGATRVTDERRLVLDGIGSVEIVGLCTNICVIANALLIKSHYPEIEVTVDATCCAGTTPTLHRQALDVMESCMVNVIGG